METETVAEHLAGCPACTDRLAELAAEDAALKEALQLDEAEMAWAEGLDLTAPVLAAITSWYLHPSTALIAGLLLLGGGWGLSLLVETLMAYLSGQGIVGTLITVLLALAEGIWTFVGYLSGGGLLAGLWPTLTVAGALWLWQHSDRMKEA